MPKYLLMIVEAESAYVDDGEAQFNEIMDAHMSFTRELGELGGQEPRRRGAAADVDGDVPAGHPHRAA